MEIQFYGANCIKLVLKKATVVVDDNLKELGLKSITKAGDIAVFTGKHDSPDAETKIIIDSPGEYEVSNISIQGISARAHIDEADQKTTTMFKITAEDIGVAVLGHVFADLDDEQMERLGQIDVLFIPVGGNGYTTDGVEALKLIKKLDPRIVIPTHFDDKSLKYEVPQKPLQDELKALSMDPKETVKSLKLKASDIPMETQLIVLERS